MRMISELTIPSEEQTLNLLNGYTAEIKFDAVYKRWYFNLYNLNEPVAMGIALNVDTAPLLGYVSDSLGLVDLVDDKKEYEPFDELGTRLGLVEITE